MIDTRATPALRSAWKRTRPAGLLLVAALVAPLPSAATDPPPALDLRGDAVAFTKACATGIAAAGQRMSHLEAGRARRFFDAWNDLAAAMEDLSGPAGLVAHVHPDRAMREAGEDCQRLLAEFSGKLFQSRALFLRVRSAKPATPWQAKLRRDLIGQFEDAGVALPPERRDRARDIAGRLVALEQSFERNLRDDDTRVTFRPAEMAGLPEDYLRAHAGQRDAEGNYVLSMRSASYVPFLREARDEAARQRYFVARQGRGGEANLRILQEMVVLRHEMARLHGQPSFAHLALRRRMAKDPRTVERFLEDVREAIASVERREVDELRDAKARDLGLPVHEVRLRRWDVDYYQHRIHRDRFAIDPEGLRGHFPVDRSVDFAMMVAGRLFGVRFRAAQAPAWHPDVRYFDVLESEGGRVRAGLYLDLFPREGKNRGGVMFPLRSASRLARRTPLCAVTLNLPRNGLTPGQLTVWMHEFGHALHCALSDAHHVSQGGLNVKLDFIEAPASMFEAWAQDAQSLGLFREACPDCPALSRAQIEQLEAARRFGEGIGTADEWLRSVFDLALSSGTPSPRDLWQRLESRTLLGSVEGSLYPASFGHIASGMTAGYYTYLWSGALAADLLSPFQPDMLDEGVGRRFRQRVLAQGGQREEADLVRDFLGREPSRRAWFARLAGER